jgi:hypothetical protein
VGQQVIELAGTLADQMSKDFPLLLAGQIRAR